MTPDELEELIDGFGDACFDCGAWLKDDSDLTPYETVFAAQQAARQALLQEIERLQAELAAIYKAVEIVCDRKPGAAANAVREDYPEIAALIDGTFLRLEKELEQAKAQQVHCMACGGVECHRLAEIVTLTGMESDQHLVEWVEQAKEQFALLKAGYKIEVSRSLDFEKQFKQAKERLIQTTGKAAEYDAALEALSGTDERLPLFGRIMQLRTEAKERERQLQYDLSQPNPNAFVPSTTTDGTGNSEAFRELSNLCKVKELESANAQLRSELRELDAQAERDLPLKAKAQMVYEHQVVEIERLREALTGLLEHEHPCYCEGPEENLCYHDDKGAHKIAEAALTVPSAKADEREAWLDGRARVKPAKEKP